MRALNHEEQIERKRKILQLVIHEFVRTGKPVGSDSIATTSHLDLSPATIRHILSELEKDEMITHPHTSAGRVPTDKGYRAYVDSIIELQRLAVQEQVRIQNEYETRVREIEDLMSQTSHMLSSISHYTGFVIAPKFDRSVFSSLELVPISDRRILVALITHSGLARHFMINTNMEIPKERLRKIARLINQNFQGCTLQQVQAQMLERIENAQQEYKEMISLATEIGQEIKKFAVNEVYLDGTSNILSLPEFTSANELHNLFKVIEEKQMLANLLESQWRQEDPLSFEPEPAAAPKKRARKQRLKKGQSRPAAEPDSKGQTSTRIQVHIGSENSMSAMQNLSVVSSTYQLADRTVGMLGILGPKRMEYNKMIALVDYISQTVNQLLKKLEK